MKKFRIYIQNLPLLHKVDIFQDIKKIWPEGLEKIMGASYKKNQTYEDIKYELYNLINEKIKEQHWYNVDVTLYELEDNDIIQNKN